jgi:hypothetical protein
VRIFPAENLRFPEEGSSAQGQSGANARPKGVADAHPVNIPELPTFRYHDGGTQEANRAHDWTCGFRHVGGLSRQIRRVAFPEVPWRGALPRKAGDATLPRKASKERSGYPYRKPTQVGEENILRRECDPSFRNSANWPRNFGIRGARLPCTILAIVCANELQ